MRIIAVLFVALLPCLVMAQGVSGMGFEDKIERLLNPNPYVMRERAGEANYNTVGSPYVFDEFKKGIIYLSNKMKASADMINYNCYTNQVHFYDGNRVLVLNSKEIDYLEFITGENSTSIFKQIFLEDKKMNFFMKVLYNKHSVLYKRYFKEYNRVDNVGAYSSGRDYNEYVDRYKYYITLGSGKLQLLKPKKKYILNIMTIFKDEIEDYMKKEKINLKSEADLVKLVKYYDSLVIPSQ